MNEYLDGTKLYGDDFDEEQIRRWHEDEREAYAELVDRDRTSYKYEYHALNQLHGFRFIKNIRFRAALGLGSAFGDEFLPIANQIERLTILEPSQAFRATDVGGVPCEYVTPTANGLMPFEDKVFDLVVCLGVLHHIPNVTTVVKELHRCLLPGGYLLLREPIVSMGDWSKPRRHATKRERGIPLHILRDIISGAGFLTVSDSLCVFPGVAKACHYFGVHPYNVRLTTRIDSMFCRFFRRNARYHATRLHHKIRPASAYFVLRK